MNFPAAMIAAVFLKCSECASRLMLCPTSTRSKQPAFSLRLTPIGRAGRTAAGIRRVETTHRWRGGRVAEGGGLLNRYRGNTPIVGSNPIPSATSLALKEISWLLVSSVMQSARSYCADCHRIATANTIVLTETCSNRSHALEMSWVQGFITAETSDAVQDNRLRRLFRNGVVQVTQWK
jgi:hypothetical protein